MQKIRRRKYLVNKRVQFRYLAIVIVPLILLLLGLYYLLYYSVFNQILIPEALATTLLPAMKKANIIIALVAPILLFIILRVALIYSNRIIGPLGRLEKDLERVIAGDFSVRLKVRAKDELKDFVHKINLLLEKVDGLHKG